MISDWTQRIGLVVHLTCFIHASCTRKLHWGKQACLCLDLRKDGAFWGRGRVGVINL